MKNKVALSLIRLAKLKHLELDEKRLALAEMQAKLISMHKNLRNLEKSRQEEIEFAKEHYEYNATLKIFLEKTIEKEAKLKKNIYSLADFMVPVQESVRESFREVKSLEIAAENLQNKLRVNQEKAEQAELDEIGINMKARII